MEIRNICVALLMLLFSGPLLALGLPQPPAGFTWVSANEIKGAFLKPEKWYFKRVKRGNTQAYFITAENIDKEGYFTTGLTVNVVHDVSSSKKMDVSDYAASYIMKASRHGEIIKDMWERSMGPFQSYGVVTRNKDARLGDYNTHHLVISNKRTGTIYILVFEAPAESWDEAIKTGNIILGKLMIDGNV